MAASVLATVMFAWSFIDCCESSLLEFLVQGGPILVTSIFLMMYLEPTLIRTTWRQLFGERHDVQSGASKMMLGDNQR